MSDLSGVNDTLPVRLGGVSLSSGLPDNYADVNTNAQLLVFDAADGSATGGTAAGNSSLAGGIYNTTLPSLTNEQQASLQLDSNGRLLVDATAKDNTGSGTVTALNGSVVATTNGCGSVTFNVTGTWVATLSLEATVDGVTWETTNGSIVALDITTQFFSTNAFVVVPCGGFSQVRLIATAFTSGTANVAWNAGAGSNVTPVFNNVAAAFNAQVVGNVAAGSADSGNGVKVSGVFNTPLPTLTTGERGDVQVDSSSRVIIAPLTNVSVVTAELQDDAGNGITSTSIAGKQALDVNLTPNDQLTFSASATVTLAALATDVVTITGNATTTVTITEMRISGISTTAVTTPVLLIKRSAANTGGTHTALVAVPHDSNNAAADATGLVYTVNPTALGAAVGTIRQDRVSFATTGTVAQDAIVWDFGTRNCQGIVLRGTAQTLAINLNGITVAGGSLSVDIEWTET
jgi:hypothetical protein